MSTMIIDGQPVTVVRRRPPLQQRLDGLLGALQAVTVRLDIVPTGAARQCTEVQVHRFVTIREGRHLGLDAVVRDLRIQMCRDCGAVCVRDISYDRFEGDLAGLSHGRRGPARRDEVIGWYSGARRNGREYR